MIMKYLYTLYTPYIFIPYTYLNSITERNCNKNIRFIIKQLLTSKLSQ